MKREDYQSYIVQESSHLSDLVKIVNNSINEDDYLPVGGVVVTETYGYIQAMVKKEVIANTYNNPMGD